MPWVRFDDQFSIHRKVTRLSDAAFRLHVSTVFWCARNLTDGSVPEEDLEDVCARVRSPQKFVTELVDRGLWHRLGEVCGSEMCPAHPHNAASNAVSNGVTSGWVIHDYLEYQPTKERVVADRKANAERQQRHRDRQKSNGVSNAVSHGGSNDTPTRPDPEGSKEPSTPGKKRQGRPKVSELPRPEVDMLCELLAGLVEKNGFPRPEINQGWRDECRKLLDRDGKTVDQVRTAIEWATGHKRFWWKNIRSMPTLRKQWDELAAQALAEQIEQRRGQATEPPRVIAADDERCSTHPRQLAGHCALCAADAKGRAA